MQTVTEFLLATNPDTPQWVLTLGELLHSTGVVNDAALASVWANDMSRIPQVGQGLQKIVEGLTDLRMPDDTRLSHMQIETLRNVLSVLIREFSATIQHYERR